MKYYIFGYKGNMARRYTACLRCLGHEAVGHDVGEVFDLKNASDCSGIIIASPTDAHIGHLLEAIPAGLPILCEKPVSKGDISWFRERYGDVVNQITVVNQYDYLVSEKTFGLTYYNYFKSGQDGPLWDCINIIGLAKGKVIISNSSPIWSCQINGHRLSLSDMDEAYVRMLSDWIKSPKKNWGVSEEYHRKVDLWMKSLSESKLDQAQSGYLESL